MRVGLVVGRRLAVALTFNFGSQLLPVLRCECMCSDVGVAEQG